MAIPRFVNQMQLFDYRAEDRVAIPMVLRIPANALSARTEEFLESPRDLEFREIHGDR
jgi:hypothetical protein